MLPKILKGRELRRYRRVALDAPTRVVINSIDEYEGQLVNISPGDLAVRLDGNVSIGDVATAYVEGLDVIEGRVSRRFPDGFAMSYRLSRSRRVLLTEQLMLKTNGTIAEGLGDRRTTPRHKAGDQRMVCRLPDGGSLFVRVVDKSVDGLAVEASRKPPIGASIHVGQMRGIVMRYTPRGFVVVYDHGKTEVDEPRLRAV